MSNKLHSIYAALDTHQYSRAIKLCLALPSSNLMARALLAHAYAKSEQRYLATLVLQNLLVPDANDLKSFPELQLELKYSMERRQDMKEQQETASAGIAAAASQQSSSSKGGGKKGKKKPAASAPAKSKVVQLKGPTYDDVYGDWDLVDQLDTPPILPEDWEQALPGAPAEEEMLDGTLLDTMTMTLTALRLYLTSYQVYVWALQHSRVEDVYIIKQAIVRGLTVWLAPQYQQLASPLLAHLQVLALQWARLQQQQLSTEQDTASPTLWAAQMAQWQIELPTTPNNNASVDDAKRQVRLDMLPRLAESLAGKAVQQEDAEATALAQAAAISTQQQHNMSAAPTTNKFSASEAFLLYVKTLEGQEKWDDLHAILDARLKRTHDPSTSATALVESPLFYPSRGMLLEYKAKTLQKLEQYDTSLQVLRDLIIQPDNADQWDYWQRHIECDEKNGAENSGEITYAATVTLVDQVLQLQKQREEENDVNSSSAALAYPLRAPYLAQLEVLKRQMQKNSHSTSLLKFLVEHIQAYATQFACRVSCTYDDLSPYMQLVLDEGGSDEAERLLQWLASSQLAVVPHSDHASTRRRELRGYLFSLQLTYKVIVAYPKLEVQYLPAWKDVLRVWKDFRQTFEQEEDFVQKENQPADEVILLVVQQLLYKVQQAKENENSQKQELLVLAATILEAAIQYSPHNAHLKLYAMFVFADLNAVSYSWDLFKRLFIKHIQHESCTHVILPMLRTGGMYQEVLNVCKEILRLQQAAIRDTSEYTGRAMENGTVCKADEFVIFQRERLNKSLTTLEAKGLILDCAPMYKVEEKQEVLGALHGIVGGDEDADRIRQIVAEAHNPYGCFSLLRLDGTVEDNLPLVTENRDLTLMSHEILVRHEFATGDAMLSDSMRRSLQHGLLLRAGLCLDTTKGPKKGKVVKSSTVLAKRCKSLLACVAKSQNFSETNPRQTPLYKSFVRTMLMFSRTISVVCGGLVDEPSTVTDNLEFRENQAVLLLQKACQCITECRVEKLTIAKVGQLLPDCIVPIFALFQMVAKSLETFGWGKRKRKTRKCAAQLAETSIAMAKVVDDLLTCLTEIPSEVMLSEGLQTGVLPDLIDDADLAKTMKTIQRAQQTTRQRIEPILQSIQSVLSSFYIAE